MIDQKLQKLFNGSNIDKGYICSNLNRLERLNAITTFGTLRKTKEYEREREVA